VLISLLFVVVDGGFVTGRRVFLKVQVLFAAKVLRD
jgi:hypothetical protein